VNFLIDNSLAPAVAEKLREAGHDSVHVRRYGIHKADDDTIFARAAQENRVLVATDTDFANLLAVRGLPKPSVILLKRTAGCRPDLQARLLLANQPSMAELLEQGCVLVIEESRIRSRTLPLMRSGKD
jgi:predicted nuclease of predicted toxin-antitoxin system